MDDDCLGFFLVLIGEIDVDIVNPFAQFRFRRLWDDALAGDGLLVISLEDSLLPGFLIIDVNRIWRSHIALVGLDNVHILALVADLLAE